MLDAEITSELYFIDLSAHGIIRIEPKLKMTNYRQLVDHKQQIQDH